MFRWLARRVVPNSTPLLVIWLAAGLLSNGVFGGWLNRLKFFPGHVPGWNDVVEDGQFAFLPHDVPSLQAEELFKQAFPKEKLASSIVLVMERPDTELTEQDRTYITETLLPDLQALAKEPGSIITRIRGFNDSQIGKLLDSADSKATLVIIELKYDFLDVRNKPTVKRVEQLLNQHAPYTDRNPPAGLKRSISGAATVGRDMLTAEEESANKTQMWTIILVVSLLIAIYRAPFVALIPLLSVFVSLQISLALLIWLSWLGHSGVQPFDWLKPFSGMQVYISVVVYGAGVDYCLFMLSRYKEELDGGLAVDEALNRTLERIGPGLTASAGTVACGIGTMVLALFGKFQQAGVGMAFSLGIMLLCALTFTPALLRLAGKYVFWPHLEARTSTGMRGCKSSFLSRWIPTSGITQGWEAISNALMQRPGTIWLSVVAMMLPFATVGVILHDHLSYGLLTELPASAASVIGTKAVQNHFAAGETGAITALIYNPQLDFTDGDTFDAFGSMLDQLTEKKEALGLTDIRSPVTPLGLHVPAGILTRGAARRRYISSSNNLINHAVRLDLVLTQDPFSRGSMRQVEVLEAAMRNLIPDTIRSGTQLYFLGTTPSILDLKTVTDRDQIVIDVAVMGVVLVILILLLRMISISIYLVLSVFFSYFVSLGITICVFWLIDPQFAGIDWKVPIFLFTILVAVGEDYNIFLMARVQEEQRAKGPVDGIRTAMLATGSIISSCGVIMAGTFFSLVLAGQLRGSQQLGAALSIGVLLDTFIIRPILVPAWLIMLNKHYFGKRVSRLFGAQGSSHSETPPGTATATQAEVPRELSSCQ